MAKITKTDSTQFGKNMKQVERSCMAGGGVSWYKHQRLRKKSYHIPKLQICLLRDLVIPKYVPNSNERKRPPKKHVQKYSL
jgi:hypothetical protein